MGRRGPGKGLPGGRGAGLALCRGGGSMPCRPPLPGEPRFVPSGASAADALMGAAESPPSRAEWETPGSPHPRGAAPNPFLAESSSLAATSSSRCAAYGSRPALAQTSLGTALKLSRPGWGAPSPAVSPPFPCSPVLGRGLHLLGPEAAGTGAACAGAVRAESQGGLCLS